MDAPTLRHKEEFQEILADYHMSIEASGVLASTPLVVLVGPTSAGRNTIINALVGSGQYYFIVSDTTRPKRLNNGLLEQDGVEYFFRDEISVLEDLRKGQYVEAAIIHDQQVSGVSIREIAKARSLGKIAITEVEITGAKNIVRLKPNAMAIFVLPPSFEEWLARIKKRTAVTPTELRRRLESAVREFRAALEADFYHFVINNNLEQAIEQIDDLARFNTPDASTQDKARRLLEELLQKTIATLEA